MYLNQLTIIGFTGSEADVHYTTSGKMVVTLSVATKESWKNADGEWQSHTEWHRVVLFGSRLAEYGRTLAEGSHVMVQGSVRTREYEKDGVRHRIFELRADSIGKLDRAERRQDTDVEPAKPDPSNESGSQVVGLALLLHVVAQLLSSRQLRHVTCESASRAYEWGAARSGSVLKT